MVIFKAAAEELISLYGDGQNVRDWLIVDDHVDALLRTHTKPELGFNEKALLELRSWLPASPLRQERR